MLYSVHCSGSSGASRPAEAGRVRQSHSVVPCWPYVALTHASDAFQLTNKRALSTLQLALPRIARFSSASSLHPIAPYPAILAFRTVWGTPEHRGSDRGDHRWQPYTGTLVHGSAGVRVSRPRLERVARHPGGGQSDHTGPRQVLHAAVDRGGKRVTYGTAVQKVLWVTGRALEAVGFLLRHRSGERCLRCALEG